MASYSSILRLISRKTIANLQSKSCYYNSDHVMMNCGQRAMSSYPKSSSPWLMLPAPPPAAKDMNMKFYNLAENKVFNLTSSTSIKSFMGKDINDIELVSSSHGWLTLFNPANCDLFLFNPLSGHHVKLPSIHTLPIPKKNLRRGFECLHKLITSCSPEQQDCRVMMSFGPEKRLAFCSPTSTAPWTPIGALTTEYDNGELVSYRPYEDFVYSNRHKLFYCITHEFQPDLEAWDLDDISSPKPFQFDYPADQVHEGWPAPSLGQETEIQMRSLLVDNDSDDLFIVHRYAVWNMAPDGSSVKDDPSLPYKTVRFGVYKYDWEKSGLVYMDASLDGLALFIGNNHSFAVSPSKFGDQMKLKPNSIYFTDVNEQFIPPAISKWVPFGGHDLGIFDYENKTFSPCYYPFDRQSIQRIIPAPMWFTPTN